MNWIKNSRLWVRISAGFAVVLLLVVASGMASRYGMQLIGASLDHITGPAWDTADGAMEASIHIQAQLIATQNILAGNQPDANRKRIAKAGKETIESIDRLRDANLIDTERTQELVRRHQEYCEKSTELLQEHARFTELREEFRDQTTLFVKLSEALEAIGDNTIEELSIDPDAQLSWSSGLSERWSAADGGMESAIGFLTQLYYLEQLLGGEDIEVCLREIATAKQFHKDAMHDFLTTSIFDGPIESAHLQASFPGETYSGAYRKAYANHVKMLDKVIAEFRALEKSSTDYVHVTGDFLDFMLALEEEADQAVEGMAGVIEQRKSNASLLVIATIIGCIVAGACAAAFATRSITGPIAATIGMTQEIAESGDLTRRLELDRTDELGQMAKAIDLLLDKVQLTVNKLAETSGLVSSSASTLSSSLVEVSDAAQTMKSNSQTVATSMNQMNDAMRVISVNTEDAANVAKEAAEQATKGKHEIDGLGSAAQDIGRVVQVIEDIAEQTNLLALNATIEAARAGDAGRGFSVVATEVKQLSQQTAQATEGIRGQINEIQKASENAIESITAVNDVILQVDSITRSIASAIEQQSATTECMSQSVEATAELAHSVTLRLDESAATSEGIAGKLGSNEQGHPGEIAALLSSFKA